MKQSKYNLIPGVWYNCHHNSFLFKFDREEHDFRKVFYTEFIDHNRHEIKNDWLSNSIYLEKAIPATPEELKEFLPEDSVKEIIGRAELYAIY